MTDIGKAGFIDVDAANVGLNIKGGKVVKVMPKQLRKIKEGQESENI